MRLVSSAVLLAVLSFISPAYAQGALAVAIPDGGLRENLAFGRAIGGSNAEERAMNICREQARARKIPEEKCKTVETFRSACISIALDSVDRWAGWAVAENTQLATAEALKKCAAGGRNCKTHSAECDR